MEVLLTRPSEDAISTASYLKNLSVVSCITPLLKIKRVKHKKIDGEKYNFFLFTSKNGVKNFNFRAQNLKDTQVVFAVGQETNETLLNVGYKNLVNTDGNLDNLKIEIVKHLKHNSRIIHPTYLSQSKIRVKERASDDPISYITTVGLYSPGNELLAVAKLSEPLKKTPANEFTLRVRLDY